MPCPPPPPPAYWQVRDLAARSQARKNKDKADDDSSAAVNQPQRWSDYTVEFHFPEPSELAPPLIQLIDVDFKYPSRWEGERGGLAIGVGGGEGRVGGIRPCSLPNAEKGSWGQTAGGSLLSNAWPPSCIKWKCPNTPCQTSKPSLGTDEGLLLGGDISALSSPLCQRRSHS